MSKVDNLLRLRTVSWRWIFVSWVAEFIALSFATVIDYTPVGAIVFLFMAMFGGWQLDCVSERNEWHEAVSDLPTERPEATTG